MRYAAHHTAQRSAAKVCRMECLHMASHAPATLTMTTTSPETVRLWPHAACYCSCCCSCCWAVRMPQTTDSQPHPSPCEWLSRPMRTAYGCSSVSSRRQSVQQVTVSAAAGDSAGSCATPVGTVECSRPAASTPLRRARATTPLPGSPLLSATGGGGRDAHSLRRASFRRSDVRSSCSCFSRALCGWVTNATQRTAQHSRSDQ
jgi:hypothetical protein